MTSGKCASALPVGGIASMRISRRDMPEMLASAGRNADLKSVLLGLCGFQQFWGKGGRQGEHRQRRNQQGGGHEAESARERAGGVHEETDGRGRDHPRRLPDGADDADIGGAIAFGRQIEHDCAFRPQGDMQVEGRAGKSGQRHCHRFSQERHHQRAPGHQIGPDHQIGPQPVEQAAAEPSSGKKA